MIVAIESGDLVVDVGSAGGAREGGLVELWRPMRVRHPVTGQILVDRIRLGTVRLSQVQTTLSLAKTDGPLLREPRTGDLVVLPEESAKPARAEPTRAEPGRSEAPTDADAQALGDLFAALEGSTPEMRARAYETFLRARPKTRFNRVLREEIAALRRPLGPATAPASSTAPAPATEPKPTEPPLRKAAFVPIGRMRPGQPQRVAVEIDPSFVGAVVHVRRRGGAGYRSIAMESVGPRYWAATLPGDAVADDGTQYFVEGVTKTGAAMPLVGSAERPRDVPVDPHPVTGKDPATIAQVSLQSEYLSFNAKKANDYLFQTEGAFGWRLREVGIRAVRSGFGVLRGKGGSLEDLETRNLPGKDVGLTYGYVEGEIGLSRSVGLLGRPILGLREGGMEGGAQAFVRVGSDLATNLMIGGEVLGSVGMRGIVQLEWRTIPRVPIMLRSEVTNQPAGSGSDVGARLVGQAGYEIVPRLALSGRLSYQGRTINHAGPGAGLAVSYQW